VLKKLMTSQIENADLVPIIKVKDWYFKGNENKKNITFYEFTSLLNEARKNADLYLQCNAILPIIEKSYKDGTKLFIRHSDVGINFKRGNEFMYHLIDEFNMANGFTYDVRFAETITEILPLVHDLCHNKYSNTISVTNLMYNLSENAISKEFKVHRQTAKKIKHWFAITPLKYKIESIYFSVKALAENMMADIEMVKDKHRKLSIVAVTEHPTQNNQHITPSEAFNYPLELENSILNVEEEEALQRDPLFYVNWYLFNYGNDLTNEQKSSLIERKEDLFKGKFIPYWMNKVSA
jgi:hypothetical protein